MARSSGHRTPVLNPGRQAKCEFADQTASDPGLNYFLLTFLPTFRSFMVIASVQVAYSQLCFPAKFS